jgi:hypothetical protein
LETQFNSNIKAVCEKILAGKTGSDRKFWEYRFKELLDAPRQQQLQMVLEWQVEANQKIQGMIDALVEFNHRPRKV